VKDKKKEILKRIKSLDIYHINQIDTDYQLDVEIIELFVRTHYVFGDISEIEKDKKVNLLITKVIEKIYENKTNDVVKNNNQNYKKEIEKIKKEAVIRAKELADLRKKEQKELEKKKRAIQKKEKEKEKIFKDLKKKKIKLKDTPDFVRKDKKIIKEVLEIDLSQYEDIHSSLKSSKSFNSYLIIEIGNKNNIQLIYDFLNKDLKRDKEIVEETFLLLSEKDEKKFFQKLPKDLKRDKAWIISLIKNNVPVFHHIDKDLKKDKDIFKAAIMHQYSGLIKTAPLELQNDKKIIAKVVSNKPELFEYASDNLKKNKKFIFDLLINMSTYQAGLLYKFIDKKLQKSKSFIQPLIKVYPSTYHYLVPELKKDKELFFEAFNNDEDSDFEFEHIDHSILSDKNIINKNIIINKLSKKLDQSYGYDFYFPNFIEKIHPSLLKSEEIFEEIIKFKGFHRKVLDWFDPRLVNKYKDKYLVREYHFQFWHGEPFFPDTYIFNHSDKVVKRFDTTGRQDLIYEKSFINNETINGLDTLIINKAFSSLKFKKEEDNRYYQKFKDLPVLGFPSNPERKEDQNFIGYEMHADDEDYFRENNQIKYLANYDDIYEIVSEGKDIGKFLFSTNNYRTIQMFYSSLKNLFKILNDQFYDEDLGEISLDLLSNNKLDDFIFIYSQIFLNELYNEINPVKLKKTFIKDLNHFLKKFDLKILDCHLDTMVWPGETDVDYNPNLFSEFQFYVRYKGINNRIES